MEEKLKAFAKDLFKIDAIKFGEYKTKIGLMTPVYCDLRVIVSYPKLLDTLAELMIWKIGNINSYNLICGVPYTALPIATVVSIKSNVSMVMRRKEAKDYGTKKLIEGVFKPGDNCLIIEDVITSGSSILETVKDLTNSELKCTDAIILLNREQGGEAFLKNNGIKTHALFNLTQLMEILQEANYIDSLTVQKVRDYLATTKVDDSLLNKSVPQNRLKMSFEDREKLAKNPIAKRLFEIMRNKQTTLCVAADILSATDLLNFAEKVGPHICALKTHIDIVEDFNPNLIQPLQQIADRHDFVLFEDRKFADIGKTVEYQYSKGVYSISSWAPLVTVHSLMGPGVLDAIKNSDGGKARGVFLLAEASSAGNLISENYTKDTIKMAEQYPELITGIVCQSPLFTNNPGFIQLCPGVQLDSKQDNLGQKYDSPLTVVLEKGADVAVVGRGISQAPEPAVAAEKYKIILWNAYLERIKTHVD